MSTELVAGSVWSELHEAVGRRGRKIAAVAYVGADGASLLGGFGEGDILVCNAGTPALCSGATNPHTLAALQARGVAVYNHDRLHAKVYVIGSRAYIGSANASLSSGRLDEAMIRTSDPEIVAQARRFALSMRKTALPIDDDYLVLAYQQFKPSRGTSQPQRSGLDTLRPPVRLVVADCVENVAPPTVEKHWRKNHDRWLANAGTATRWSLTMLWGDEARWVRRNDWVLPVVTNVEPVLVSPPMRVLAHTHVGGRSKQYISWLREPTKKQELSWERLVGRVLARAQYRLKLGHKITSAPAVDAVFDAWKLSPED